MRERDKHFALAVDEILEGIDQAFAQKSILATSKNRQPKGLVSWLINLINIFR